MTGIVFTLIINMVTVSMKKGWIIDKHMVVICGLCSGQDFMQDKIITSHTCFGGHMDVNC